MLEVGGDHAVPGAAFGEDRRTFAREASVVDEPCTLGRRKRFATHARSSTSLRKTLVERRNRVVAGTESPERLAPYLEPP